MLYHLLFVYREAEEKRGRHGSGADLHTSTRALLADPDAESESCFGVYIPFHSNHFVLYSRCYARQLRSTGLSFPTSSARTPSLSVYASVRVLQF